MNKRTLDPRKRLSGWYTWEHNLVNPPLSLPTIGIYGSPIEELLAWEISKYLGGGVVLSAQVDAPTEAGRFVLDFTVQTGERRIGIECDGREYHEPLRDERRDAYIIAARHVEVIYRLRGQDLFYHPEDVLFVLSKIEPAIFSACGRAALARSVRFTKIAVQLEERDLEPPVTVYCRDLEHDQSRGNKDREMDYEMGREGDAAIYLDWRDMEWLTRRLNREKRKTARG